MTFISFKQMLFYPKARYTLYGKCVRELFAKRFRFAFNETTAGWHKNNHHVCRINKIPATANKTAFERWTLSRIFHWYLFLMLTVCVREWERENMRVCLSMSTGYSGVVRFRNQSGVFMRTQQISQFVTMKMEQAVRI